MKRTVDQAMDTMTRKRDEAKEKAKAKAKDKAKQKAMEKAMGKKVMKKPAAQPAKAKNDDEEEEEGNEDEEGAEGEDGDGAECPPRTPASKGTHKTKMVTPAHGKRGAGNKTAKLSPPTAKAVKKPIDISDLAVLTKKTMNATTRECFTSKAYHAARQRAKAAGKSPDEMKVIGRQAYAASAASWDKLAMGS